MMHVSLSILVILSVWCSSVMSVGLEIPGGKKRVDPAFCHPAMRGDPGIRALLVQAGSLQTDWCWHRDSSRRKDRRKTGKKKRQCEGEEEGD